MSRFIAIAIAFAGALAPIESVAHMRAKLEQTMKKVVPRLTHDLSTSTAYVVSETGLLLTTAHGVAGAAGGVDRDELLAGKESLLPSTNKNLRVVYSDGKEVPVSLVYLPSSAMISAGVDFAVLRLGKLEKRTDHLSLSGMPIDSNVVGEKTAIAGYSDDLQATNIFRTNAARFNLVTTDAILNAHREELSLLGQAGFHHGRQAYLKKAVSALEDARLLAEQEAQSLEQLGKDELDLTRSQLSAEEWQTFSQTRARFNRFQRLSELRFQIDARDMQFLSSSVLEALDDTFRRMGWDTSGVSNRVQLHGADATAAQIAIRYAMRLGTVWRTFAPEIANGVMGPDTELSVPLFRKVADRSDALAGLHHMAPGIMSLFSHWIAVRSDEVSTSMLPLIKILRGLAEKVKRENAPNGSFAASVAEVSALSSRPRESEPFSSPFNFVWDPLPPFFSSPESKGHWTGVIESKHATGYGGSGGPLVALDARGAPKDVLGVVVEGHLDATSNGAVQKSYTLTRDLVLRVLSWEGQHGLVRELLGN